MIEKSLPLIEQILEPWKELIAKDYLGYRNHLYRMVNYCFAIRDCTEIDKKKIIIAAAFHDLGLWSAHTLDYLPPSITLAEEYLKKQGLADWSQEISLMIDMHHKVTKYDDESLPLVEVFRRADLVDVSLGVVTFGISADLVRQIKETFPNHGFHKMLCRTSAHWLLKHPLNPMPILKW